MGRGVVPVHLYVSSFPKDALSDVPDATSAKTLAEVLKIPFCPYSPECVEGHSPMVGDELLRIIDNARRATLWPPNPAKAP